MVMSNNIQMDNLLKLEMTSNRKQMRKVSTQILNNTIKNNLLTKLLLTKTNKILIQT